MWVLWSFFANCHLSEQAGDWCRSCVTSCKADRFRPVCGAVGAQRMLWSTWLYDTTPLHPIRRFVPSHRFPVVSPRVVKLNAIYVCVTVLLPFGVGIFFFFYKRGDIWYHKEFVVYLTYHHAYLLVYIVVEGCLCYLIRVVCDVFRLLTVQSNQYKTSLKIRSMGEDC